MKKKSAENQWSECENTILIFQLTRPLNCLESFDKNETFSEEPFTKLKDIKKLIHSPSNVYYNTNNLVQLKISKNVSGNWRNATIEQAIVVTGLIFFSKTCF
jgi:hypothetical protein